MLISQVYSLTPDPSQQDGSFLSLPLKSYLAAAPQTNLCQWIPKNSTSSLVITCAASYITGGIVQKSQI